MYKGYSSRLVCESVCLCVCPSVCLSVTALAASAYVYTAKQQYSQIIIHCSFSNPSLLQKLHAQVHVRMYCMHLHQKWAEFPLTGSCFSDWSQFSTQVYTPKLWRKGQQKCRVRIHTCTKTHKQHTCIYVHMCVLLLLR